VAKEITIMLGGEAGQGVQSVGQVLSRSFARLGLHVFALQDFESRIRGGHAFFQLRASESRVGAHLSTVDILIALTEETIHLHESQLGTDSVIIYDSDNIKGDFPGSRYLPLKLVSVSREETSNSAMANTVALGAVWSMMGLKLEVLEDVLGSFFGAKSADIVEKNVKAARRGIFSLCWRVYAELEFES
jgi:2-oxoglutarate ferredoxin oxidoreductase subunit alpha